MPRLPMIRVTGSQFIWTSLRSGVGLGALVEVVIVLAPCPRRGGWVAGRRSGVLVPDAERHEAYPGDHYLWIYLGRSAGHIRSSVPGRCGATSAPVPSCGS